MYGILRKVCLALINHNTKLHNIFDIGLKKKLDKLSKEKDCEIVGVGTKHG